MFPIVVRGVRDHGATLRPCFCNGIDERVKHGHNTIQIIDGHRGSGHVVGDQNCA